MGRILALDYGSKRTGIAITDELQLIASGLTTVVTSELMIFLKQYIASEKVALVLVGEPKQKDGTHSSIE
ncbi:MAG: Holliday junction resolvase RuvX, partial [Aequorivita sp.]|nr:Holliday junction resolvase RuvX [Aequorivita sp.]